MVDRCICCGEIIPEGRQVCIDCENSPTKIKERKDKMKITPLASGSSGNAYLINDGETTILIDAGIPFKKIQIGTGFNVSELNGVLISHEHKDHCKAVPELIKNGVDVYALPCVFNALKVGGHRCHPVIKCSTSGLEATSWYVNFRLGSYEITPFDCQHDVPNLGYYIHSTNTGENLLYFTDSYYVKHTFPNLNYILAEANYSSEVVKANINSGRIPEVMKRRLLQSHMSIDNLLDLLKANDLSKLKQIYLLHLSSSNSDEAAFKERVQKEVGCEVYVC